MNYTNFDQEKNNKLDQNNDSKTPFDEELFAQNLTDSELKFLRRKTNNQIPVIQINVENKQQLNEAEQINNKLHNLNKNQLLNEENSVLQSSMSYWRNADVVNLNQNEKMNNISNDNHIQQSNKFEKQLQPQIYNDSQNNYFQNKNIENQVTFGTTRETQIQSFTGHTYKIDSQISETRSRTRTHTQIRRKTIDEKNRSKSRSNTPDKQISSLNYKDVQKMNEILTPDIIEYQLVEIEEEVQQQNQKPQNSIVDIQDTIQFQPTQKKSTQNKQVFTYQYKHLKNDQNQDEIDTQNQMQPNQILSQNNITTQKSNQQIDNQMQFNNFDYDNKELKINYENKNDNVIKQDYGQQKNNNQLFDFGVAFKQKKLKHVNTNKSLQIQDQKQYDHSNIKIFQIKNTKLQQDFKTTQTSLKQNLDNKKTQTSLREKQQNKIIQTSLKEKLQNKITQTSERNEFNNINQQNINTKNQVQNFGKIFQINKQNNNIVTHTKVQNINSKNQIQNFGKIFQMNKQKNNIVTHTKVKNIKRKKQIQPIIFINKPFMLAYKKIQKQKDPTKELMEQYYQNKINQYEQLLQQNKIHFQLENNLIDKNQNDYFLIKKYHQQVEQFQTIQSTDISQSQPQNKSYINEQPDSQFYGQQQWSKLIPDQQNNNYLDNQRQTQQIQNVQNHMSFGQSENQITKFGEFDKLVQQKISERDINIRVKKRILPEKFVKVIHDDIELILKNYGEIYRTKSKRFIDNLEQAQKQNIKNIFQKTQTNLQEYNNQDQYLEQTQFRNTPSFPDQEQNNQDQQLDQTQFRNTPNFSEQQQNNQDQDQTQFRNTPNFPNKIIDTNQNFQNTYKISDLNHLISHQYSNQHIQKAESSKIIPKQKQQQNIIKDVQGIYIHPISDQNIKGDNFMQDYLQNKKPKNNEFYLQKIFQKYDNIQVIKPKENDQLLQAFKLKQQIIDQLIKQNGKSDQIFFYLLNQKKNEFLIIDSKNPNKEKLMKFTIVTINKKNSSLFSKSKLKRQKQKYIFQKQYSRDKRQKKKISNNKITKLIKRNRRRIFINEQIKKINKNALKGENIDNIQSHNIIVSLITINNYGQKQFDQYLLKLFNRERIESYVVKKIIKPNPRKIKEEFNNKYLNLNNKSKNNLEEFNSFQQVSHLSENKLNYDLNTPNFIDYSINKKKLIPIQIKDRKSFHKHCKKPTKEFEKFTSQYKVQKKRKNELLKTKKKNISSMKKDYYNDKKEYYVEVMRKIETKSTSSLSRSPKPCRSRSRSYNRSLTDTLNCVICHKKLQLNF